MTVLAMIPAAPTDHLTLVEAVLAAIKPLVAADKLPAFTAKVEQAVHDHFHPAKPKAGD